MRSVSIAIWTSGEPVSVSCLPNDFVAFCFASLVRAMRLLRFESPPSQQTPRKEDAHGRGGVARKGSKVEASGFFPFRAALLRASPRHHARPARRARARS